MEDALGFICGGCCSVVATQIQYLICGTRQYGADASCCDNCCRCNCGWKNDAPLPVEDYPIANSGAEDRTQTVDPVAKAADAPAPAYEATPQMSATAAPTAVGTAAMSDGKSAGAE